MARVQINYKSRNSMVITCDSFAVKRTVSGVKSFEWENATPNPLFLGIDDVESVWEL